MAQMTVWRFAHSVLPDLRPAGTTRNLAVEFIRRACSACGRSVVHLGGRTISEITGFRARHTSLPVYRGSSLLSRVFRHYVGLAFHLAQRGGDLARHLARVLLALFL